MQGTKSLLAVLLLAVFLLLSSRASAEGTGEEPKSGESKQEKKEPDNSTSPGEHDSSEEDSVVDVFSSAFTIYQDGAANKTLFIRGTGFTEDLEFEFDPSLAMGKRVQSSLYSEQTIPMFGFRLLKGKTWLTKTPKLPYEVLYITKVTRKGKVVFEPKEKVPVARVFPRPELDSDYIPEKLQSDQVEFVIKGTNLSPKETKFIFDPPLEARQDYDYIINEEGTKMTLSLRRKAKWRATTGPLSVVSILGGAGRIILPKPVVVATVSVSESKSEKSEEESDVEMIKAPDAIPTIYNSFRGTSEFTLKGTGFRADRPPTLKFSGEDVAVQGQDFDLTVVSRTELTLRLRKTSQNGWLKRQGVLSVEELNGETLSFPVDVAEVLETPEVERDRKQLVYESQTPTIIISGRGFVEMETSLEFSPTLKQDEDFIMNVRDSRTVELQLVPGKKWPQGVISVLNVATGNGRRIYQNKDQPEKGVRIALVEPDFEGVIKIKASSQRIYQTETESISVQVLVLPPKFALKEGEAVSVKVELTGGENRFKAVSPAGVKATLVVSDTSAATLVITLTNPRNDKWLDHDGRLLISAISLPVAGDPTRPMRYPLGGSRDGDAKRGVQIARVLPDIGVEYINPPPIAYASHTSSIPLKGSGFTFAMGSTFDVELEDQEIPLEGDQGDAPAVQKRAAAVFDPPLEQDNDFVLIFDSEKQIIFELLQGKRWRSTPGELRLVSLDSGAGPVEVNAVIARVAEDDPDMICTNDCPHEAVYDGVCKDDKANPETGEFDCWGRDCADCGPRKKSGAPVTGKKFGAELCSDTCGAPFVGDGICEDGRPGAWSAQCPLCTDCKDCGQCNENKYSNRPMCTNGVEGSSEELVPGIPCVFPFTYKGVTYDGSTGCVKDGRVSGGWGWCPTTEDYKRDLRWGSCQYCSDVLNDPKLDESQDYYGGSGNDIDGPSAPRTSKGFDFVRWMVNTLFFLVIFTSLGGISIVLYRRRSGHAYHAVSNKAN